MRMALKVAREGDNLASLMESALRGVREQVTTCSQCGAYTFRDRNPCPLCLDGNRTDELLCVVEDPGDILLVDEPGVFKGRYFALMAKLSPRKQEGINNPRFAELVERVASGNVREVFFALNTDVESDATVQYLIDQFKPHNVKVSRLAFGLPAGSGVAFSDAVTLSRAIRGRTELQ